MQKDVVVPTKSIFYKRYVENTHVRGWKNIDDKLFQNLNCYCQNIKLTLGENPKKFLDTKLIKKNDNILTQLFTKLTKCTFHWSSEKSQLIINVILLPINSIEPGKSQQTLIRN